MLASRLLSTLMLLQTRGRMTAPDLAKELEVSVRTVYRDIDQLSAAGIPVTADRGRDGGFQLLNGFRTQLTGLTQAEAEALMLAGLPGPAAELGLADRMSSARLKLMAALPTGMRAERVATRFHLDVTGWFRATEPVALLPTVARAVWSERLLKIRYRQGGDSNEVRIGPLGLVLKAGVWYLVAQKGSTCRTYRASNILAVESLDEHSLARRTLIWHRIGPDLRANTSLATIGPMPRSGSRRAGERSSICWARMLKLRWRRPPASPIGKAGFVARFRWNPATMAFGNCCGLARTWKCSRRRRCEFK